MYVQSLLIPMTWLHKGNSYLTCASHRCCALVLVFIEIPLLLRICPTSAKFDAVIRKVTTNYMRAGLYAAMGLFQILSAIYDTSSLIAAGVIMLLTATCYAIAGFKNQDFVASKALGGQGVAQMIV